MLAMLGRSNNFLKFSSNHTILFVVLFSFASFDPKIEGNGHFGLLKFKHFRNSMGPEPLRMCGPLDHDYSNFLSLAIDLNVLMKNLRYT